MKLLTHPISSLILLILVFGYTQPVHSEDSIQITFEYDDYFRDQDTGDTLRMVTMSLYSLPDTTFIVPFGSAFNKTLNRLILKTPIIESSKGSQYLVLIDNPSPKKGDGIAGVKNLDEAIEINKRYLDEVEGWHGPQWLGPYLVPDTTITAKEVVNITIPDIRLKRLK